MERVNKLINHKVFQEIIKGLREKEKNRIYCKHDLEHLLNVARVMWITNLENQYNLDKELVYATALLHDIGRLEQYENGRKHALAGVEIAYRILKDCSYTVQEQESICRGVRGHSDNSDKSLLGELLYEADILSRNCFICDAKDSCYWGEKGKSFTDKIKK